MTKLYKLIKDLPTFEAGDEFEIRDNGGLYLIEPWEHGHRSMNVCAYCKTTLEKFPNILRDWFEEILERPETVWDLKDGDECYEIAISYYGPTAQERRWNINLQHERSLGLITITKEECEKKISYLLAKEILKRDTKGFKPDWRDEDQDKWDIYYDYEDGRLHCVQSYDCVEKPDLWFATKEDAEESIKVHSKEWKFYLGVE